jgi:hypothetical protein
MVSNQSMNNATSLVHKVYLPGELEWSEFTEFCIEMGAHVADKEESVLKRSEVRTPKSREFK